VRVTRRSNARTQGNSSSAFRLDEKRLQFLYFEAIVATFMDNEAMSKSRCPAKLIGEPRDFLHDGIDLATLMMYEGSRAVRMRCRRP